MAVVNVGTTITAALTKMTGGLPRAQFVTWFNEIVQDILRQPRTWNFLNTPATIAIVNNTVTVATGAEIVSIVVGTTFLTRKNLLSAEEAFQIDNADSPLPQPYYGYTIDSTGKIITFHPSTLSTNVASALVTVQSDLITDYADNAATIFPYAFQNLFITGLRMHYYDQSKDGRYTKESMQYQINMLQVKAWDNRQKSLPKFNSRGYIRGVP